MLTLTTNATIDRHQVDEPGLPGGAVRGAYAVEVATTIAELEGMRQDWLALQALAGPETVFQSYAQIHIWARSFLTPKGPSGLHVAMVREAGRPVLILPLVAMGLPHFRMARLAGDPVAQYSDVLVDPAADGPAAFKAALYSAKKAGMNGVILRRVRADSQLLRLAGPYLRGPTSPGAAPYADLSGYADYEAYLSSLSKNMRKGLRNRRHHLEKAGAIAFDILTGPEAREALDEAIVLKRHWLIRRGALSSAFLERGTRACFLELAENSAQCGSVVLRLQINGETAAIRFGFEYRGTYFAYMTTYSEKFAQLSPGKMLMHLYMAHCRQRGVTRIDMLPPVDSHKTHWCAFETGVADYTLPLSLVGRTYASIYQERLRPGLRRAWHAVPDNVRSLAAALFVTI